MDHALPVKMFRRAGGLSPAQSQLESVAAALLPAMQRCEIEDDLRSALDAAGLTLLGGNTTYEPLFCVVGGEADEDRTIWRAILEHLLSSGALLAAVRHALDVATEELPGREACPTPEEVMALVLCSEANAGHGPHLDRTTQWTMRLHVSECSTCGPMANLLAEAVGTVRNQTAEQGK
jgi:hypothetical protein